ncbi:MAG: cation transporter [Propionibacteriaceae bacterium]|jgi:divalent metal cation (Fe/Co/Zn/Cd) transporter|nr:cation transporter [Propionibacteriaceae bacterium]
MTPAAALSRRQVLRRRVRLIVAFTIAYNLIEAAVSIWAGSKASSAALLGFGLDSLVEVLSAAVVAWQFAQPDPERWEKPALRAIAVAFFALAAYVTVSAVLALAGVTRAEHSAVGLVIAGLSSLIMPVVSGLERRAGRELGSATVVADSKQTLICASLSVAVLVGLLLNLVWGWFWADSVAALVIAGFAVREGWEAWRGDSCATSVGRLMEDDAKAE